jgi:hypothetical protein
MIHCIGTAEPITIEQIKKRNLRINENPPFTNRQSTASCKPSYRDSSYDLTEISSEAPLPKDFNAVLKQLQKWGR